jgi:predicted nucleic acid-binding protein
MITALDTNVLFDLFLGTEFCYQAKKSIGAARLNGSLIISEIVYAELSPIHPSRSALDEKLDLLGIILEPFNREIGFAAGQSFLQYRKQQPGRGRILADFLIGTHAAYYADALLTRDRGFYRSYFKGLKVIDPTRA